MCRVRSDVFLCGMEQLHLFYTGMLVKILFLQSCKFFKIYRRPRMSFAAFANKCVCIILLFIGIHIQLTAQTHLFDKQFTIHQFKIDTAVQRADFGTRGLLLTCDYSYLRSDITFVPALITLRLRQRDQIIYTDSATIVPIRAQANASFQLFIPYRQINLSPDYYDDIALELLIPNIAAHKQQSIKFTQPARYRVELALTNAEVKEKLREWDAKETAPNWRPDPYWTLTSNEGIIPLQQSEYQVNTHKYKSTTVDFFILQNETLYWTFYDEDGSEDTRLARVALPPCVGDAQFPAYAEMIDDIKELAYTLNYKQLVQQPITIYVKTDANVQQRVGVQLDVDYHLSRTYRGTRGRMEFSFFDKNGQRLDVQGLLPTSKAMPRLDSLLVLDTRGKLSYFVPFYMWNNDIQTIEFAFVTLEGHRAKSTPYILQKPVAFEPAVSWAQLDVQENFQLQGASGVLIKAHYRVQKEINTYSKLLSIFNGSSSLQIYLLQGNSMKLLSNQQWLTLKPAAHDSLAFFVPYLGMSRETPLTFGLYLQPDGHKIPLLADTTLLLHSPARLRDIAIDVDKVSDYCLENDYGKVVEFRYKVPLFLREQTQIRLIATRNGRPFDQIRVLGCVNPCALGQDTGSVRVVFPYRYLQPNDSISLQIWAEDAAGKAFSDVVRAGGRLPEVVNNQELVFKISKLHIDKKVRPKDSTQLTLPWVYTVRIGSQTLEERALLAREHYNGIEKNSYELSAVVHREDKIAVGLTKQDTSQRFNTWWKGDFDRLHQLGYTIKVENKHPLDAATLHIYPSHIAGAWWKRSLFDAGLLRKRKTKRG